MESITQMLDATRAGDRAAGERLFSAVYSELKVIARSQRRRWVGNHTINTTALIHEAFLKLSTDSPPTFANRTHFYATAARAMRQILVNYAEQQRAAKRGGDAVQVPLEDVEWIPETTADELLDPHEGGDEHHPLGGVVPTGVDPVLPGELDRVGDAGLHDPGP